MTLFHIVIPIMSFVAAGKYVYTGESVELSCIVHMTHPNFSVITTKSGQVIPSQLHYSHEHHSLTTVIVKEQLKLKEEYVCVMERYEEKKLVDRLEKTIAIYSYSEYTIISTAMRPLFILDALGVHGVLIHKLLYIEWFHCALGKRMVHSQSMAISILLIFNLFLDPPEILYTTEFNFISEEDFGKHGKVICAILTTPDTGVKVTWLFEGEEIDLNKGKFSVEINSPPYEGGVQLHTLLINDVQQRDLGSYVCQLHSDFNLEDEQEAWIKFGMLLFFLL